MLRRKRLCGLIGFSLVIFFMLSGIIHVNGSTVGYYYPDDADDAGHIYDYNEVKANDDDTAYTQWGLTWANLRTWDYGFGLGSVFVDEVNFKIEAKYNGIGWCRFRSYVKYSNGTNSDTVTDTQYFTGSFSVYYVTVNIEATFNVDTAGYYFYITQGAFCTVYIDYVQVQIEY